MNNEIIKKSLRMQSTSFLLADCRRLRSQLRDNWLRSSTAAIHAALRDVQKVLVERRQQRIAA